MREDEEEEERRKKKENDEQKLLIDEREVEMIKGKYLGTLKDQRKPIKTGDKFKQVFVFEWDAAEDTS